MFPLRTFVKSIHEQWTSVVKTLTEVQNELVQQRTNCLSTLQSQGEEQIELLDKMSTTLEAMHGDQKQTMGMLLSRK